ncbi:unnamed protein product [Polarella glacialis]|uniref:EamA domain-containing protein n=2 Tax=Polarella glacialis TaxID=89957 RepID=A0A813LJP4_POLGL|nr:unnamed protein product [Polarella glacialis]
MSSAILQAVLLLSFLTSNVWQRVAFKNLGYALGSHPIFVLLSISGAFVAIFAMICLGIVGLTGGWLPETRTWRVVGVFWIIGVCNGLQGAGMVFANPYVPGCLQALLQQALIPFTLAASVAAGARFEPHQYCGVALILGGIGLQLLPGLGESSGAAALVGGAPAVAAPASMTWWSLVFLVAQVPVALAAILQEKTFRAVPVNVFHMLFWASTAQFLSLLLLLPLPSLVASSLRVSFQEGLDAWAAEWQLVSEGSARAPLFACIVAMLVSQLTQTLMVKYSSAAFTVVCMALAVPASAVVFTMPAFVGAHRERMTEATLVSLALVFVGIVVYRLGACRRISDTKSEHRPADEPLLGGTPRKKQVPDLISPPLKRLCSGESLVPPQLCSGGVGIIQSEYSNASDSKLSIWEERTLRDHPV